MDWYRRDIPAAIRGMAHLTLEERGAYNTIIDHEFLMGRHLPDNDHYIAGLMGCRVRVWRRVKRGLLSRGCIGFSDGLIVRCFVPKGEPVAAYTLDEPATGVGQLNLAELNLLLGHLGSLNQAQSASHGAGLTAAALRP